MKMIINGNLNQSSIRHSLKLIALVVDRIVGYRIGGVRCAKTGFGVEGATKYKTKIMHIINENTNSI